MARTVGYEDLVDGGGEWIRLAIPGSMDTTKCGKI